jgi:elongation factor G
LIPPDISDFAGEVIEGLAPPEGAVICVTGKSGVEVGSEKAWKYATDRRMPKMVFVTKMTRKTRFL